MPFVKIWIHAVWSTKNRKPILTSEARPVLFSHIHENAIKKGILWDCVNGHLEHVHCMFRLKNDQMIKEVMQLTKGESSFWFNRQQIIKTKLDWQDDYFAVSVSESQVPEVRRYIANQEEHHRKKTFAEEYNDFISKYGFTVFDG